MNRITLLFLLLGVLAGVSFQIVRQGENSPNFLLPAEIALGLTPRGVVLPSTMTVESASDLPLSIVQLGSTCGCVVTTPTDNILQPNGSLTFPFAVATNDLIGAQRVRIHGSVRLPDGKVIENVTFGFVTFEVRGDYAVAIVAVNQNTEMIPGEAQEFAVTANSEWLGAVADSEITVEVKAIFGDYTVEHFRELPSIPGARRFSLWARLDAQYSSVDSLLDIHFLLPNDRTMISKGVSLEPRSGIVLRPIFDESDPDWATMEVERVFVNSDLMAVGELETSRPSEPVLVHLGSFRIETKGISETGMEYFFDSPEQEMRFVIHSGRLSRPRNDIRVDHHWNLKHAVDNNK